MGFSAVALVHLEAELPGAIAWARRLGVSLTPLIDSMETRLTLTQPGSGETFFLRGRFDEYRQIAPEWTFTDAEWTAAPSPSLFPKADRGPRGASVFHQKPVICAPFNRLAYQQHGGPHNDWGGPANWRTAGQANEVRADTIGDMLSVIYQHFLLSRGRMG